MPDERRQSVSTVLIAGVDRGPGEAIGKAFEEAGWAVATDEDHPGPLAAVVANAACRDLLPGVAPEPIAEDAAAMIALAETAPDRMPGGGAILFVTGTGHFFGHGAPLAYATAKGSIVGATRALAVRHGSRGVRVNTLTLGLIQTPALDAQLASLEPTERAALEANVVERTPVRRIGRPEDVGEMCVFLASERARAITGVEVVVDGGLLQLNKTFSYNPPAGNDS
jgi:NAD(P)-dependent dehydrogenase (short-subunit alcohol dehydrogenase family)